ncbi:hypothetical protein [Fibrobacter sp. UWB11]|uniref:hypothetical protein n=1 Tax=Fibrobacter sp. UWB11 TaxID=1896202 RepID=UPI00092B128F|nr:hypothetical protein [Fibrobacter sp. UWB11]SIN91111.1 hypothetical protein SAMN05720758_0539 [Fibrobacter sp. UWB11]
MNYITKSISQTIVGAAVALAFTACSSSNSVAPEASVAQIKEEPSKQIRLEHQQDSTYTPPIFAISDETKETLESWLNGNPISNDITVDYWCAENPDYPENPLWCLPNRIQLENGTAFEFYNGNSDVIACETYQDTIFYSVYLHSNTITKKWTNPWFNTEMFAQSKLQFKESCKAEFGDITEETETKIVCNVKIEPSPSQDDPSRDSRKYFKPHYFYNYLDIYWNEFASQTIEACRIRPQIEPITTF